MTSITTGEMVKLIRKSGRLHLPNYGVERGELPAAVLRELERERWSELVARLPPGSQWAVKRQRGAPKVWQNERAFQRAIIEECDRLAEREHPLFGKVCHIANGNSHHEPGVRAGKPDLWLSVMRRLPSGNVVGGLYAELKVAGGCLSPEQVAMHVWLHEEHYLVYTLGDEGNRQVGVDKVIGLFRWYIQLDPVVW